MPDLKDKGLFKIRSYIGGCWTDSDDGSVFEVNDPATGRVIARVARCGATETRRAVEAADGALAAGCTPSSANLPVPPPPCRLWPLPN